MGFNTTETEEAPWRGLPVCIDFDEVSYISAAANETRAIRVKENKPFAIWKEYPTRTEFYSDIGGKQNAEDYTIEDIQRPFKIHKAFKNVDEFVLDIMNKCDTKDMKGYMGSGSPRDFIATVEVYKGNREGMLRPVQLPEVRQYCVARWDAIEVDGTKYEADDMLAIEATQNGMVQCSQDKDAVQVEGWLLKPAWSEPQWMNAFGYVEIDRTNKTPKWGGCGEKALAMQVATNDSSDNYHANKLSDKRFGIVKAEKMLTPCKTREELWSTVTDHFKWLYPEPVEYKHAYTGEPMIGTWHSLFSEYFQLARMKRSLDDQKTGYDLMDELGIDYGPME